MYSLWFVQWDFTRRDHPGNLERVSESGPVMSCQLCRDPAVPCRDTTSMS